MLWYKSWLETRYRILMVLGSFALVIFSGAHANSPPLARRLLFAIMPLLWAVFSVMLAGAGIKTQAAFRSTKGLHRSMYFTLSLPVSRFRLLAVRAGLGMLETVGVIAAGALATWAIIPELRSLFTTADTLEYLLASAVCASSFYFLSVFLATFLDDMWQIWARFIATFILRYLLDNFHVPPSLNVFSAMGDSSPLFTHTLPWTTTGVSLLIAALLFFAALRVVQAREY